METAAPQIATVPPQSANFLPFEPEPALRAGVLEEDSFEAGNCGKRIGILIVTYNALTTLTKVLKRIPPNVWKNVEEIAVFDDASQDATYELALGIKTLRQVDKLQVISNRKNLGYGGNQKQGYSYFLQKGFDAVVLLHGDGQYAPEILSMIYSPIVRGEADAVFGSRMMRKYGGALRGGMPVYKYVGNRILSGFENRMLGLDLTEFHSGYRAYNLHALKKIDLSRMTDDFHFDTEIIIKLNHQGYRIKEVPIPTYYGRELCYVNGLKYARDVVRAVRRYKQTCESIQRFPEFQEYFIHYPIKRSKHSSHDYAIQMTGLNHNVLDIGCGAGFFANELVKRENKVTGIDSLPLKEASSSLERYIQADLRRGLQMSVRKLRGRRFDRVLLLDVLEHLESPERVLRECHDLLQPDGRIIVSLPNVANISVRLMLLLGRFDYQSRGIMDCTHLRFYTTKTARRLLEESGYKIVQRKYTVMPLELPLGLSANNVVMIALNRILSLLTRMWPGLFAYQTVFMVKSDKMSPVQTHSRLDDAGNPLPARCPSR